MISEHRSPEARRDQAEPRRTSLSSAIVAERLAGIRDRISGAGGNVDDVTVVAVTKGHGPPAAAAAIAAGLTDVGENYAAELVTTAGALGAGPMPRLHFLGGVQRNKVRSIAGLVDLWQGVDRLAAGREIARRRAGASVLVQVNISGEVTKSGCALPEAPRLVDELADVGLDVRGLMAVGPNGPAEEARAGFRELAALADRLGLPERSMGMTDDLEVAVSEGATMIRVGRGLFGPRNGADDLRR